MKKPKTTVADRIKRAREQAQLSPVELRHALRERGIDLSKTGLYRLESIDAKNPNLKLIQAIAEITNVSPSWILFGEGAAVPGNEVGKAIRGRVIDTIELMVGALDLTARQESTIQNWLRSVRENQPKQTRKPYSVK
ncbi:MAG: hypothetical protein AAF351_09650 [Pseudomonadota bacterium]